MKKLSLIIAVLVALVLSFGLVACDENDNESTNTDTSTDTATDTIQKYQVIFDSVGGTPIEPQEIEYGHKAQAPQNPTKNGYTFDGWYVGDEKWSFIGHIVTDSVTLVAKWEAATYQIDYELNGGKNNTLNPSQYTIEQEVELNEPSREFYTFLGWYDNATFDGETITKLDVGIYGNKTLYAKWEIVSYQINYVLNGGKNNILNPSRYTIEQEVELNAPTRAGYTFVGWYDNATFDGEPIAKLEVGSYGNKAFYAAWRLDGVVYIYYEPGQGMLGDDEWEVVINKGDRKTTHPTPTHSDVSMMFDGWFEDELFTIPVKTTKKYDSDITLYAKWTKVNQCLDGLYEHPWGAYYTIEDATCTKPAVQGRDCPICGSVLRSDDLSQPALGHDMGPEVEAGFAKKSTCRRTGCGKTVYTDFVNCTRDTLGNNPFAQVQLLSGDGWGMDRVGAIVDGIWDQANSAVFAGRGDEIKIRITLKVPSSFDRIYIKGRGASAVNVYVKYQGDSELQLLGSGAFLSDYENLKDPSERKIPFVEVDSSKVVEIVELVMPTPSNGNDYWEEVGFFKLPEEN